MRKHWVITTFILILALGAFFRFYLLTEVPPGLYPDEAMNGNNALEALATGHFKTFYPENNGREGLFINLQALSILFFGNTPWALRMVSAVFGMLAILAIYLAAKEFFANQESQIPTPVDSRVVALLSAFFLATSYWHVNFSRIGFRAITIPFFTALILYFLLKGLRRGRILDFIWAGVFMGLGFYTYLSFRFMPFVVAIPMAFALWQWRNDGMKSQKSNLKFCIPCALLLFVFVTIVVTLPLDLYFLKNPADFIGRSGQVSIFSAASPIKEFLVSNAATIGMFFVRGDCNFRHNYGCLPELHPLAALFFAVGIGAALLDLWKKRGYRKSLAILGGWFFFMMLPATLTREGLPHALRSIGLIPPVMILSGFGAWRLWQAAREWCNRKKEKWPQFAGQLGRIQRELTGVLIIIILFVPLTTYDNYFLHWRNSKETYGAFAVDLWHLGEYLNVLPRDIKKYVVVNLPGTEVRGIPMGAQTVMFATDTFRESSRKEKNIEYVLPEEAFTRIVIGKGEKTIITFLNSQDHSITAPMQKKFPQLRPWVPGDFGTMKNY